MSFVTMHAIRTAARQDGQEPASIDSIAEKAAHFLNAILGIEVIDGYEHQPEDADLTIARDEAAALEDALRRLRFGFRLVRTSRSVDTE